MDKVVPRKSLFYASIQCIFFKKRVFGWLETVFYLGELINSSESIYLRKVIATVRMTGSYLAACFILERKQSSRNYLILGFLHLAWMTDFPLFYLFFYFFFTTRVGQ